MSYILDALKKSEKERTLKRSPSVASIGNDAPSGYLVNLRSILALVLIIAVANSAAIFLFFPKHQKETLITTADMKPRSNLGTRDESYPNPSANWQQSQKDESGEFANQTVKETGQSPPTIDVTSHIYADEPHLRMVKINGVDRGEGDYLDSNHRVVEITELGIILEYYGRSYNMNVLEEWQLD